MIQRVIPSTGELLPVIGMGTWQTFDVNDNATHPELENVLREMHRNGGRLIDSSPMYGQSERVIGDITQKMDVRDDFFYATKVWTTGKQEGMKQMEASMEKMQRSVIDLMQVHNLTDLKTHLRTLRQWKEEGRIRYIGITHYTDASHEELQRIIQSEPVDFVQFNYSILSRNAENGLLQTAADAGVATLINRPLGVGNLHNIVRGATLPQWATEAGIESWSGYFLQYIISHPAVTCVIPATSSVAHAAENFKAGMGALPDEAMRKRMAAYMETLG